MTTKFEEIKDTAEGAITPEGVAAMRRRMEISIKIASEPPIGEDTLEGLPGHEYATRTAIRSYTEGVGDKNPLYRDSEYAAKTRWGGLISHPTMILHMGVPLKTRPLTPEEREVGKGGGLPGVHAMYSGEELEWFQPIREGDRLTVKGGMSRVEEKTSDTAGNSVHVTSDSAYRNQRDELVVVGRSSNIRYVRSKARKRRKHLDIATHQYTEEEMARIDADYEKEEIRGAIPRYWEDVVVGEEITPVVKGPWSVSSFVVFQQGVGNRGGFYKAHSRAYEYRKRHPQAYPLNEHGFPESIARVHWDPAMARVTGLPTTYDSGLERISWMAHGVTNWIGDDGFMRKLSMQMRRFVINADTVWIKGQVADKYIKDGEYFVELEIHGVNQRGEDTAPGRAWVLLPSKTDGPVKIPTRIPDNVSPYA